VDALTLSLLRCYTHLLPPSGEPLSPPLLRFLEHLISSVVLGDRLGERVGKVAMDAVGKVAKRGGEEVRGVLGGRFGGQLAHTVVCCCLGSTTVGTDPGEARDGYVVGNNFRAAMGLLQVLLGAGVYSDAMWREAIRTACGGRLGEGAREMVEEGVRAGGGRVGWNKFWFVVGKVVRNEEDIGSARARVFGQQ
jgi:hypothetical protein